MTTERRKDPRSRVLRRGKIVFRSGYSVIDCVVLDVSLDGARLRVGEWLGLPKVFELRLENGSAHRAEVCYRNMAVTGVHFVEATAACS